MIVYFVNIEKKYLFIKEYKDNKELYNIIRKIYFNPHSPILPLLIDNDGSDDRDYYVYNIRYYHSLLGSRIMPNFNEYMKYNFYKSNKNK